MSDHPADRLDTNEWERKFLVKDTSFLSGLDYDYIEQCYLWDSEGYAIRVRGCLRSPGVEGDLPYTLTLKGPRIGNARFETELELPAEHGSKLINASAAKVSKKRYSILSENEAWVVDVFEGRLQGLVVAEIETSQEQIALIKRPQWATKEVTSDARYANENLARMASPPQ